MHCTRLLALPLSLFAATTAHAEDSDWCRNGLFPSEPPFALAEVTGTRGKRADRLWFLDDADGCPDKGVAACKGRAYAIPGDRVVVNRTHGPYTCAFYPGKGGGTAGWVETRRIAPLRFDAAPPEAAWIGRWDSFGNPALRFTGSDDGLTVTGEAFWPGPPGTHDWPTTHSGEIAGRVTLTGNTATYSDDDLCEITFTMVGDWLVAGDNGDCGGANVSFSAVYQRGK